MHQLHKKKILVPSVVLAALVSAGFACGNAEANTSQVENHIETRVSSGGVTMINGQVVASSSSNSVKVKTVINGVVVEDFATTTSNPVHYTSSYATSTGIVVPTAPVQRSTVQNIVKPKKTQIASTTRASVVSSTTVQTQSQSVPGVPRTGDAAVAAPAPFVFIRSLLASIFAHVSAVLLW